MKYIYTDIVHNPFFIATNKITNTGVPLFFKHILPFFSAKNQEELNMSVTIFDSTGRPIPETHYIVYSDFETETAIYHNFISNRNKFYSVQYTMYPKTVSIRTYVPLNSIYALTVFDDYASNYYNSTYYTVEDYFYIANNPFRNNYLEPLLKSTSYVPDFSVIENGNFKGSTTNTSEEIHLEVPLEKLSDSVYYINTNYLDTVNISNSSCSNTGIIFTKNPPAVVTANFKIPGTILKIDGRSQQPSIQVMGQLCKRPLRFTETYEMQMEAGPSTGKFDLHPFDSEVANSSGMLNILYKVDNYVRQIFVSEDSIASQIKPAGILEAAVDIALNRIDENYVSYNPSDVISIVDRAYSKKQYPVFDYLISSDSVKLDNGKGQKDTSIIKTNAVANPGILDLFVLDAGHLDMGWDYNWTFDE